MNLNYGCSWATLKINCVYGKCYEIAIHLLQSHRIFKEKDVVRWLAIVCLCRLPWRSPNQVLTRLSFQDQTTLGWTILVRVKNTWGKGLCRRKLGGGSRGSACSLSCFLIFSSCAPLLCNALTLIADRQIAVLRGPEHHSSLRYSASRSAHWIFSHGIFLMQSVPHANEGQVS